MPLEMFLSIPFSQYLQEMATEQTYDNELTLRTASNIYNVGSTLGRQGQLEVNPTEFQSFAFGRIVFGCFAEGYGKHCVGLDQEWQENQSGSSTSLSNEENEINVGFNLSKSNDYDSYTSQSMRECSDDCNVGAENFPSGKEHEQNDETRSHSGKLSKLI